MPVMPSLMPTAVERGTADLLGWMQSLADPIRLRLLRILERHELGVLELCEILQLPQSTVSRHLKVLGDDGWLRSQRRGTANLYRVSLPELDGASRRLWQLAREQTENWPAVAQDRLRLAKRLANRRKQSQRFFAGAAGQWDKLRGELYGSAFSISAMLALLPSDWVVADLGCGTGHVAAALAPAVGKVIGVDNSPAMLRAARRRTAALGNVDFRSGDLEALPIDAASCDAALLILVLTYVADPTIVLREAARVIRLGGKVVVVDLLEHGRDEFRRELNQQHAGFEAPAMAAMLKNAGFEPTGSRSLDAEPQAKGPPLVLAIGRR
jgi:ArsR family transcriptional regulator